MKIGEKRVTIALKIRRNGVIHTFSVLLFSPCFKCYDTGTMFSDLGPFSVKITLTSVSMVIQKDIQCVYHRIL